MVFDMSKKTDFLRCRHCNSHNIVKNGHNRSGSQQYWCKDCDKRCVLEPKRGYSQTEKEKIIAAYHEKPSLRAIQRTYGVSPQTLTAWLKESY